MASCFIYDTCKPSLFPETLHFYEAITEHCPSYKIVESFLKKLILTQFLPACKDLLDLFARVTVNFTPNC